MAKAFSIRSPLQGELLDFVKSSKFHCHNTTELVRDLTCLLASYREEDVPVFPDVFVLSSFEALASLSPGTERITIGKTALNSAAAKVLKDCATLAERGWGIFVVKTGDNTAEYGVFRSLMHSFATSAEEIMVEAADTPVILIRNRGRLVVELRNGLKDSFTASFTSALAAESAFAKNVSDFVTAASKNLADEQRNKFQPYLVRLLVDMLQHSHGTLLSVYMPPADGKAPETLKDGVWLEKPIDLAASHNNAVETKDAQSLANLQSLEALFEGMISCDGVVVLGTNGTILGYRIFLKPTDEEKKGLPEKGGGRRRTYSLMQRRLGNESKAAFFRSQDGETECQTHE